MDRERVLATIPGDLPGLGEDPASSKRLDASSDDDLPYRATSKSVGRQCGTSRPADISSENVTAFGKLPPQVIELILWLSDSNTFASLVLLNRQWNRVSQQAALYAHHLSRCPSYALTHEGSTASSTLNDLTWLKAKFAQETRRNLFDAFVRPSETLVNLICTSTSSSAAFPRGEALRFAFSSHGQTLLALSSSRIFVVNLLSDPLAVTRELKTMRRPLSAAITDDGSLLAVLSSKHQANIYSLTEAGVSHLQVIVLENTPRTISLVNEGTVLAAAYEGGVEVFSLAANALSTDRRAVRCEPVDSLSFSSDGSMLIGSSHNIEDSNTVVITAPFYTENDPDLTTNVLLSRMWTTQILFPQNSSTCSHAALLNSHTEGDINWLFVYDKSLSTYRAVRADDTRTGMTYFLAPNPRRHSIATPHMLPSVNLSGELAVAGFSGHGLFLYGIPEKVDNAPDMRHVMEREENSRRGPLPSLTSATGYREPLMAYSPPVRLTETMEDDFLSGSVDWRQSLFVRFRQLATLEDAVGLRWVENPRKPQKREVRRRLAVVASGGVSEFAEELGEEIMPVDGGRVLLLDFDYAPHMRENRTITIEVGEKTPEVLPEQRGNLDFEVALLRRRSIREALDDSRRLSLNRSMTTYAPPSARMSTHLEDAGSRAGVSQPSSPLDGPGPVSPIALGASLSQAGLTRSQDSLRRSVTAAGIKSTRYQSRPPPNSIPGVASGPGPDRRTNERTVLPDESKAGDWEPPPPYSRSPEPTLPDVERFQMLPRNFTEPLHRWNQPLMSPQRASTTSGDFTPHTASYANIRNLNDRTVRQQRFLSSATLDTLSPPGPAQSPLRRSEQFSRIQSLSSSVSPLSSPRSTWAPGSQSCEPTIRMAANLVSPKPDNTQTFRDSEEMAGHHGIGPRLLSGIAPASSAKDGPLPTLTGVRLQHRLNYPVPPRPSQARLETGPTYIPTALQVGKRVQPTVMAPSSNPDPFLIVPPTSDQMVNLNRRASEIRRRPVPIPPSGQNVRSLSNQDSASVPPLPPESAWGAASVPSSSSFGKPSRSPRSIFRDYSHSDQPSASTPDLVSPRAGHDRLETIESARSLHLQQERARSRSHGNMERPQLTQSNLEAAQKAAATDLEPAKRARQRRGEKEAVEGSRGIKKWRTSRCILM